LSFKPEAPHLLSFYGLARFGQMISASRAGHSSCPHFVRRYSTFGGLMMDDPLNDAVVLQLPELLNKHLLRESRVWRAQDRETKHFPANDGRESQLQRPSRNLKACLKPLAAVAGVCLFSLSK